MIFGGITRINTLSEPNTSPNERWTQRTGRDNIDSSLIIDFTGDTSYEINEETCIPMNITLHAEVSNDQSAGFRRNVH